MNKIAQYLNEHILGEVSSLKSIRRRFSEDLSPLSVTPELVVFPKVTNDIRKVARFAWQLAEKGHVLGITVRGSGSDTTGAAVGKGIIINTSAHLTSIVDVGVKERLVHVQPGVNVTTLNNVLQWHGLGLEKFSDGSSNSTIGGLLATNKLGNKGAIAESVEKLEIILANGDLIEAGKISKRDVSKKKGLETFEGEIYRRLDGLLEDNEATIKALEGDLDDHAGYSAIASVRQKDGSFDLRPLFLGSQGTLGIISEVVLKTNFYSKERTIIVGIAKTKEDARDVLSDIKALEPSVLEMIDGELFAEAMHQGKHYPMLGDIADTIATGSILYMEFNDFRDRTQGHKAKKIKKLFAKPGITMISSESVYVDDIESVRYVSSVLALSLTDNQSMPPVIDGAFIPTDRHEEFAASLKELGVKLHVELPMKTNGLNGIVYVYPVLHLGEISDKQKLFRLINEYSALVDKCNGIFIAESGEGRLKANAAWALMDDAIVALYTQIREIFDPFGTLNPGVKQKNDLKHLIEALRATYDTAEVIDRGYTR